MPKGLELLKYELARPHIWLSMGAGLVGAILVHCATSWMAKRPAVETHVSVPGALLTADVAEMPTEPRAPRGAMLLAAKKIHGDTVSTAWRLIQVWCDVVAPFGIYMLIFSPLRPQLLHSVLRFAGMS